MTKSGSRGRLPDIRFRRSNPFAILLVEGIGGFRQDDKSRVSRRHVSLALNGQKVDRHHQTSWKFYALWGSQSWLQPALSRLSSPARQSG